MSGLSPPVPFNGAEYEDDDMQKKIADDAAAVDFASSNDEQMATSVAENNGHNPFGSDVAEFEEDNA